MPSKRRGGLRGFLDLPNGIPSHDTLSDVFGRLKPDVFAEVFIRWVQVALPDLADEQICLDGKTLRGSRLGDRAVHLLSAYTAKARLVLAQQAVADKANEITAIPDLLSLVDVRGAVVTIGALGCQKAIAQDIINAGAAYVLALSTGQNFQSPQEILEFLGEVENDIAQEVEAVAEEGLERSPKGFLVVL